MAYHTLGDLIADLRAYAGNDTSSQKLAAVRRAAIAAFQTLLTYHDWHYYLAIGRVVTVAPYSTGTVQYTHSTRAVDLTGGTFPAWAAAGHIRIGGIYHKVATRASGTQLTLDSVENPGDDVAAGAEFSLVQITYPLPDDFLATDQPVVLANSVVLTRINPREVVFARNLEEGPAMPREYALIGADEHDGRMALTLHPPPDQVLLLENLYKRRPTTPKLEDESSGKVATTAASAAVTGTSTAFTSRLVGSVFRVSATADKPTPLDGINPYLFESRVLSVGGATALTLEDEVPETLAGVGYTISDQVDVEDGEMWHLLVELGRKELRIGTRMNATNEEPEHFERVVRAAKAAQSQRDRSRSVAGLGRVPYRYGEYPTRTVQ
jgi:hypothetical protein